MLTRTTSIKVRYSETDQMGVVYHGNYAQYFDIGRTEWLRSLNLSYKEMEQQGILLPVVSLDCQYKKSAFYDDILTIKTTLKKIPSVKIEFEFEIINQNNELLCTGNVALAFLNKTSKKLMKCPENILTSLKKAQN